MSERKSIQETYAPKSTCFGCGPANPKGLRLRSFCDGDLLMASWQPSPEHEAFPGILAGGVIGTLLDCHGLWAAAHHYMRELGQDFPPCLVTSEFNVKLLWPTPTRAPVQLAARVIKADAQKVKVEATLTADTRVCASFCGTFVIVKPGHPAYHRR